MATSRPPYPPELRRQLIELVRSGRTPEELSREYEPSAQAIRNWVHQDAVDVADLEGPTSDERAELARLRREVKVLREEREILKKAAAWFASETGATPQGRSRS